MGDLRRKRRTPAIALGVAAAAAFTLALGGSAGASPAADHATGGGGLRSAFEAASDRYDVPRPVLIALGYAETRLNGHAGEPSFANGYGVMHLVDNPTNQTLPAAAELTGLPERQLQRDAEANIRGAAAILDRYADKEGLSATERGDLGAWYPVVARYSHSSSEQTARIYADTVYDHIRSGVRASSVRLAATPSVEPERGRYADATLPKADTRRAGYPDAIWNPANSANFRDSDRGVGDITAVVVHTTQGSYSGTISWFQNPDAQVSAHYVIRSEDGEITQMVDDADTAWHARDGNGYSIGIEHEGYVDDPAWYTDAMYTASAKVTKYACDTYQFTCDREHVVGHSEVPGNDHTDPGPNWDWDKYMGLVNGTS